MRKSLFISTGSGQVCDTNLTVSSFSQNPIEDDVRTCIQCVIGGTVSTTATWLIATTPGGSATVNTSNTLKFVTNSTGNQDTIITITCYDIVFLTLVPSGAPQNLTIIDSNSTNMTISWDSVECIHRNGLVTHYIIMQLWPRTRW